MSAFQSGGANVVDSVLGLVRHIPPSSFSSCKNNIKHVHNEARNDMMQDDISDAKYREQNLWSLYRIPSTKFLSLSPIPSTFSIKRISIDIFTCNALRSCIMFHFYHYFILLACSQHTRYKHLRKPALYGAGAAGYSGANTENEQVYADTQCRISHAEIPIVNPYR